MRCCKSYSPEITPQGRSQWCAIIVLHPYCVLFLSFLSCIYINQNCCQGWWTVIVAYECGRNCRVLRKEERKGKGMTKLIVKRLCVDIVLQLFGQSEVINPRTLGAFLMECNHWIFVGKFFWRVSCTVVKRPWCCGAMLSLSSRYALWICWSILRVCIWLCSVPCSRSLHVCQQAKKIFQVDRMSCTSHTILFCQLPRFICW